MAKKKGRDQIAEVLLKDYFEGLVKENKKLDRKNSPYLSDQNKIKPRKKPVDDLEDEAIPA